MLFVCIIVPHKVASSYITNPTSNVQGEKTFTAYNPKCTTNANRYPDFLDFLSYNTVCSKHLLQPIATITYIRWSMFRAVAAGRSVCLVWSGLSACSTQVTLLRNFGRCELFYTLCTNKENERVAFMAHGISQLWSDEVKQTNNNGAMLKQYSILVQLYIYGRQKGIDGEFSFLWSYFVCVCKDARNATMVRYVKKIYIFIRMFDKMTCAFKQSCVTLMVQMHQENGLGSTQIEQWNKNIINIQCAEMIKISFIRFVEGVRGESFVICKHMYVYLRNIGLPDVARNKYNKLHEKRLCFY